MKNQYLILLLLLAIVLVAAVLFTYAEFGTLNPIAAAVGAAKIGSSETPYIQIGYLSKAYVARSSGGLDLLIGTMEGWGYTHLPEIQKGNVHFFQDAAGNQQPVRFLEGSQFCRWIWY